MSVRLWIKWLWVRILLLSLKLQIWRLVQERSSLIFRQTVKCRFTLKLVRDITTYRQIDKKKILRPPGWRFFPPPTFPETRVFFLALGRMQEIRGSNSPVVTGIRDSNKSRARHHRSLKPGSKIKYLNISFSMQNNL